jgi:hypothetical protein
MAGLFIEKARWRLLKNGEMEKKEKGWPQKPKSMAGG